MRYILPLLMISALAVGIVCQNISSTSKTESIATVGQNTATQEEAARISLADAKADFDAGTALFVDTRAEAAYKQEHIKDAINVSMDTGE